MLLMLMQRATSILSSGYVGTNVPQLSAASCPDANAWMKARTDHLLRYGEQLMASLPGALHAALPGAGGDNKLPD